MRSTTTCEPTGVFNFNVAFALTQPVTYQIQDPPQDTSTGGISDTITLFNAPTTGLGVLSFNSDPTNQTAITRATILGKEVYCDATTFFLTGCPTPGGGHQGGLIGTISVLDTAGDVITAQVASDSELPFDPFGLGADSSDEVKFSGNVTPQATPEPRSLLLLGTGLLGLAGMSWRKTLFA